MPAEQNNLTEPSRTLPPRENSIISLENNVVIEPVAVPLYNNSVLNSDASLNIYPDVSHNSSSDSDLSNDIFINSGQSSEQKNIIKFGLTNARSLWRKLPSLYDLFEEVGLAFSIVTETWFYSSPALDRVQNDALHGHGLDMINYTRKPEKQKNRGGGVSIIFNKNKVSFSRYNAKTSGRELIVARGKILNNTRPCFVLAAYISTRLKPKQKNDFVENICLILLDLKTKFVDPLIIVAGDFNGADTSPIMTDFPDMSCNSSLPTRAGINLDYAITNLDSLEISLRGPLVNLETGTPSDHDFLLHAAELKHVHRFKWITTKRRKLSPAAIKRAADRINDIVWENLLPTLEDPEQYVAEFHAAIQRVCDEEIPWEDSRRKSTDDPWITDEIRKKIRQRKSVYRREERSRKWKKLKRKTDAMIKASRKKYYRRELEKLKQPGLLPFKVLNEMKVKERPPAWTLEGMFPDLTAEQVLERAADFFSGISSEFSAIKDTDIPLTYDRELPLLTVSEVSETLAGMKKPKSYTSIDIPYQVLSHCYDSMASAITPVINLMRVNGWWPAIWRAEEVTVIPKTTTPTDLNQTRNISCTSVFSKLAETFLLEDLNREVALPTNQYGGKKGIGTDHLLCDLVTGIIKGIDDGISCANVMSLDFAKAFNRMSHSKCISSLAHMGASNQTIRMVFGFLSERTMRIKSGGSFSLPRNCPGGAPQGTKVGNFLFAVTVASLDNPEAGPEVSETGSFSMDDCRRSSSSDSSIDVEKYDRTVDFSLNVGPYDRRYLRNPNPLNDTPLHPYTQMWDRARVEGLISPPPRWDKSGVESFNYVDDQTLLEFSPISTAVSDISTKKESRHVHAQKLSSEYIRTESWAEEIGMKLNLKKTQLLCVSDSINYEIDAYLRLGNEIIVSQPTLKILGYHLGRRPDASAQYDAIRRAAAARSWSIRHLKKSGIPCHDLVAVYKSFVRSAIEYASNVYGGLLTESQSSGIERIQANVMRVIYGPKLSYAKSLQRAGIPTLEERRRL